MVRRFTTADRWFSSLLGPTFPNRQYLYAAQSGGQKGDPGPLKPGIFPLPTIWDNLRRAKVPIGYYHTDLPILALWGARFFDVVHPLESYFEDAAAGKLANVVMVDPGFQIAQRTDDHPVGDIRTGQRWIRAIFQAFAESPQWERGLFVLVYDEWGGFFDHVDPPVVADDRRTSNDLTNFGQLGFRVPAIVASPYARPGFADHTRVRPHLDPAHARVAFPRGACERARRRKAGALVAHGPGPPCREPRGHAHHDRGRRPGLRPGDR